MGVGVPVCTICNSILESASATACLSPVLCLISEINCDMKYKCLSEYDLSKRFMISEYKKYTFALLETSF